MVNINAAASASYSQQIALIRISTAQKINSASDNASGLAITEKMRAQISGDQMATRNMKDSQSLLQTAEGALNSSHSILQRMRELSIQANNGLLTESDRGMLQQEFSHLRDSLNFIGEHTEFNTKKLLDGNLSLNTTTNANGSSLNTNIQSALASQLGNANSNLTLADIDLRSNPADALKVIDGAIAQISSSRSSIGATQNRLDHGINLSQNKQLNMQAAESRIRDADLAKEAMNLNRAKLLQDTYFATQKMQQNMMGQYLSLLM